MILSTTVKDPELEGLLAQACGEAVTVSPASEHAGAAASSVASPSGAGVNTASPSPPGQAWPSTPPKPAIQKVAYSHQAMIDMIIADPGISQRAIAQAFGYTESWVSQVISSDAFQTALAKRREEIVDPVLRFNVENNFKALVLRSQEILMEKLNKPAAEIPDNLVLKALEASSRAAGYGAKDPAAAGGATSLDVHLHLEQLGGGLVALLQRRKAEAAQLQASGSKDSLSLPSPSPGRNTVLEGELIPSEG